MPTTTTNYNLLKPLVNDPTDEDLWGDELNDDMDDIDTLMRQGITNTTEASQTTGFTATATIRVRKLYPCDATGGAFSVTLPAASASGNGATVFIKKTDSSSNAITIARTGADTLDNDTSLSLTAEDDCYGLVSDGTSKWSSICKPASAIPDASTTVKGILELATAAETLAGVDTTRALTADGFAGNKSLAANGYYKFPSGLILQWGSDSITTNPRTITFTTPFASACYVVLPVSKNTGSSQSIQAISAITTTNFTLTQGNTGAGVYWAAIGV
jgi:hypothetical protein